MLVPLRFVSLFLKPLPIQLSNNLRRVSGDDGVGGDVFGCYAGGAYDGVFADGDPWKAGNSGAVPGVFADAHILHCEAVSYTHLDVYKRQSPKLIAAYHVFLRLLVPRHPPCALIA